MSKSKEILEVTRGVLVLNENLKDLIRELRVRDIIVVEIPTGTDDEIIKKQFLPDRIFVTNDSKDCVWDATSYGYKIIDTGSIGNDAKHRAKMISDAVIKHSLWRKRHCWILTLKPDGQHKLKNLVD